MSETQDKLKQLISKIDGIIAIVDRDVPDVRVYTTPALNEIWQGLGKVRTKVASTLNSFIGWGGDGYAEARQDTWIGLRDDYVNSISPLLPYGRAINAAVQAHQPSVAFPEYGFKTLLVLQLKKTKKILESAVYTDTIQKFFSGSGVLGLIWDGVVQIYNGVRLVVGTAIDIATSLANGLGFLFKNWYLLAGGAIYYFWFRKKK